MLRPAAFEELRGWTAHDHDGALAAFRLSCREILAAGAAFSRAVAHGGSRAAWLALCRDALLPQPARHFFETRFRPFHVADAERPEGLFTGYFEPEAEGRLCWSKTFSVPLYRRPPDLLSFHGKQRADCGMAFGRLAGGKPAPYLTRREIEAGALAGQGLELVWLKSWADAFFIHIQGSGRIRLEDGTVLRLTYEAKSGLPYTGIGGILAARGEIAPERLSMQSIRRWMDDHPEQARTLMWENQSFVFFRKAELEDPALGALGAQHVQLTPRRSIAVDRSFWMFGTPIWLDTEVSAGDEVPVTAFRQLLIAQDTGSAIKGAARGDVYWGHGAEAALLAGSMKSPGRMTVLLPIPVVEELDLER